MLIKIKIEIKGKPLKWKKHIKKELKHFKDMAKYAGKTNLNKDKKEFWNYIKAYSEYEAIKYEK